MSFTGNGRTLYTMLVVGLTATPALAKDFGLSDSQMGNGFVFSPYGRVNQAYQSFDDGQERTSNIVDISGSASRLGFFFKRSETDLGFSFQFETGLGLRGSAATSQTNTPDYFDWDRRQLRQVQAIWTGSVGTFRLGQGSMSTDGIAESDLGGTIVLAKSTIPEMYGSYIFRRGTGPLSTITVGQTFDNYDGLRRFRFRYDTPDLNGFSLSASYGKEVLTSGNDDRYYDLALRYSGSLGGLTLSGGIGQAYTNNDSGVTYTTTSSVSVADPKTGLNLTVAGGKARTGTQAGFIWVKGGWNTRLFASGATKFLIEGFWGADYVTSGSDSRMWGVGMMQTIDGYNIELFAGYREFEYSDTTPATFQDAKGVQIGAQVKF